jgi:replicative DNA helicase
MPLPIYQTGHAETYAQSKNWKFRNSGDQLVLESCPFCNKSGYRFYINNVTGLWDCKYGSCARKGNFYQLQKELGDNEPIRPLASQPAPPRAKRHDISAISHYIEALDKDKDAQAYLSGRGIKLETAKEWHLGVKTDDEGTKWLLIPYVRSGEILDVKYRTLPPATKRFQRKGGGESILYGQHLLDEHKHNKEKTLYLVEGEIDAITMWQRGYTPVLSTTTGAGSFKPEWYNAIEAYNPQTVIICYDSDAAGQAGAERHVKKFEGENRVVLNIVLPEAKDANEFFQTKTNEDFDRLVQSAKVQELPTALSMGSVLDLLEAQIWLSTDAFDGVPSQFSDVNAMVGGGYWNGQLVVISGTSGTGKTSYVLQDLIWMAKNGSPTFLQCLEMPNVMMMRKIIGKEYGVPMLKIQHEHIQKYRQELMKIPFYMGDKGGDIDEVEKTIRLAVKRYDLKCYALDNLNYLVRSIDHEVQEIARVTKRLKELAIELNIPIILIAQPRKFDDEARMMTKSDLKGASAIDQDADSIILLYRRRIKTEVKQFGANGGGFVGNQSPYALVRVEKARYAAGGETYLYFEGSRSTYRELTPGETDSMAKT